jgi:hypothetical protein
MREFPLDAGLAWSRAEQQRENEKANYRRPHPDPMFAALGLVLPSEEEARAAWDGEAYMRGREGRRLPPIRFLWLPDMKFIVGMTARYVSPVPGPVDVLLKTGRGYFLTRQTAIHELDHVRAATRAYSVEEMERSAEATAALAARELGGRWR